MGRDKVLEVILDDTSDELFNEWVFAVVVEVFFLDLLEKSIPTNLGNKQSLCSSTSLKSDFSCMLEVTNEEVSLDDTFDALVPVGVSRDGLSDHVQLLGSRLLFLDLSGFLLFSSVVAGLLLLIRTGLSRQLVEEVSCTLGTHGDEVLLLLLLDNLGLLLDFLLGLKQTSAKSLLDLLDDLGLVEAEHLEEVVILALGEALHDGELKFVRIIL